MKRYSSITSFPMDTVPTAARKLSAFAPLGVGAAGLLIYGWRPRRSRQRTAETVMLIALLVAMFVAPGAPAIAAPPAGTLDQQQLPEGAGTISADDSSLRWQQGVTAGISGQLTAIQLMTADSMPNESTQVFVAMGAPWQSSTPVFSTTIHGTGTSEDWITIDTSAANIRLNAGEAFTIGVYGIDGGMWLEGSFPRDPSKSYPGGQLWLSSRGQTPDVYQTDGANDSFVFSTYMQPGLVPEPCSLALLGISLVGGLVYGWRQRKAA
jgi:hypothetical protein